MNTNETKHTPKQWIAAGCTIYTADNWRDGVNYGGKRIGDTADPENDSLLTDEEAALCEQIVCEHNSHDELVDALKFAVATLTHPVQFSGTVTEGGCAILRGDAAAVVAKARAVLAKATDETIEVPMQGRTLAEIIATSATGKGDK